MPPGKYYCDYCDKEFQDTPSARRRHLSGVQHQRARALWYDSFKDPHGGPLLQPDGSVSRGICNHFVRTGNCNYGDACRYFHPTPNPLNQTPPLPGCNVIGTAQQQNFLGCQFVEGNSLSGDVIRDKIGMSWGNLPPSLRPPEGGCPPLPFVDWG